MKIKTSKLTGTALDWFVAKCEGGIEQGVYGTPVLMESGLHLHYCGVLLSHPYSPSTDWAQGGPIIEKELMQAFSYEKYSPDEPWFVEKNHFGRHHKAGRSYARGSTILIAAMRCYVSVKLGDEVEIPDELLP